MVLSRVIEWVRVCWNVVATVPRMGLLFACDMGYTFSHHATPNRSFRISSPRSGFCMRYTRCDFSFAWVAIVAVVWGTLVLLSSRLLVGMVGNGYRVVLVPPCVGSKVSSADNR